MPENEKRRWSFIGRGYEFGELTDYLKCFSPGLITVGLSVGADEARACRSVSCGPEQVLARALMLSDEGESLPALMGYQSGQPFVGAAARNAADVISGFWVPPTYWQAQCTSTHSYEDVMRDFAAGLWRGALSHDAELSEAADAGKVLIAVSCPASADWTGRKELERLAALLREATGCERVAILPEPNAVLMDSLCTDEDCTGPLDDGPDGLPGGGAEPETLARGLCKFGSRVCEASGRISAGWRDGVKPCIDRESRAFMGELAESVYFQVMCAVRDRIRLLVSDGRPHMRNELIDAAFEAVDGAGVIGSACDAVMANSLSTHAAVCRAEMKKQLDAIAGQLCGLRMAEHETSWEADARPSGDILARVSYHDFYAQIQAAVCHSLMSKLTYGFFAAVVFVGTFGLWPVLMNDSYSNVKHGRDREDDELSPKACRKVLSNLESPGARHRKRTVSELTDALCEDEELALSFPRAMYELYETSLGQMLLLVSGEQEGRCEE